MKKLLLLLCVTIGAHFSSIAQVPGCATLTTPANNATNVVISPTVSIALAWTAPTTGGTPTGYKIRWGTTIANMTVLGTTPGLGVNITNVAANTTFFWQALPTNTSGDAVCTTIFSFTTGAAPAAPSSTCLTGELYPETTYTPPVCDGTTANIVVADAWAGEFANINVIAGQTYRFQSSVATDYIKISTTVAPSTAIAAQGTTPLTWTAAATGVIRFYIHTDNICGTQNTNRTRTVICGAILTVDTFDALQMSLYPNPATDLLNIKMEGSNTINSIQIVDLNGRQILSRTFDNVPDAQIDVNNLSAGMYLINITSGDKSITKKFLKQ